jgi:hypothetical protein
MAGKPPADVKGLSEKLHAARAAAELEDLYKQISGLGPSDVKAIAKNYTFQKHSSKEKALAAIRQDFFANARSDDKARKDKDSLMM